LPGIDLGAQYREAKASVPEHLKRQAKVELEQVAWLKKHRGVPADVLYDRTTGEAQDPALADIGARMKQAESDVAWCRAVTVAAGEAYKGESFDEVAQRNDSADRDAIFGESA
jgi:hypothetical protein